MVAVRATLGFGQDDSTLDLREGFPPENVKPLLLLLDRPAVTLRIEKHDVISDLYPVLGLDIAGRYLLKTSDVQTLHVDDERLAVNDGQRVDSAAMVAMLRHDP